MVRIARVVVPGLPHHVTQRGNRRQRTFFSAADDRVYRSLGAEQCRAREVAVWAYCLMPNHVHLIVVPPDPAALAAAIGETHRRYTHNVNAREDRRGYLWQGRFSSVAMDQRHLMAAARYVEPNPVRAGLVARPQDWPWSSARAHLAGRDDGLCQTAPLIAACGDWHRYLATAPDQQLVAALRRHTRTGRPVGSEAFLRQLEARLGRRLLPRRPGPRASAGS